LFILTAVAIMGGLTVVLATLLVFANKKLHVHEDPRIDIVENMLPNVNCGACGFPGCRAFAEALVREQTLPGHCTVSTEQGRQRIADFLGVAVGVQEKRVARLACAGGNNVARFQAQYTGLSTCKAATQVGGGGKGCVWGCLGFGDCAQACNFDALHMNKYRLPVVDEDKCTACGDCVQTCPKDLFSLHPISHRLWVACKNLEAGDEILAHCEVACTACGRCVMDAPDELITLVNNLPIIDYTKNHNSQIPIQRCPTGAIVWIEADGKIVKGPAAKKIIRKEALPVEQSL
jgi:electron transport complex protein RnfB